MSLKLLSLAYFSDAAHISSPSLTCLHLAPHYEAVSHHSLSLQPIADLTGCDKLQCLMINHSGSTADIVVTSSKLPAHGVSVSIWQARNDRGGVLVGMGVKAMYASREFGWLADPSTIL